MDGGDTAIAEPISLAELEVQITELAGQLNAANYRWLTLIAEFDRRQGWADGKLPSCAHGERMDYDLGVWVLCQQAERARFTAGISPDVPAGTPGGR